MFPWHSPGQCQEDKIFSLYIKSFFLVWVLGELSCSHVAIMASHHVHRAIMASHYVNITSCSQSHHGFTLCKYQIYNRTRIPNIQQSHYGFTLCNICFCTQQESRNAAVYSQTRLLLISKLPIFWICWHIMGHIPQK